MRRLSCLFHFLIRSIVRPHLQLHPQRNPAPLLPAATVLLLRDGDNGLEILMTRRSMSASFAPGAYVFPGGGIEPSDHEVHHLAKRRRTQSYQLLTQAVAAIRESFEELGVLLATHPDGRMANMADIQGLDRLQALAPFTWSSCCYSASRISPWRSRTSSKRCGVCRSCGSPTISCR